MLKGCFVSEKIFPQSRGLFNKKALTLFKSFKYGTNEAQVDKPMSCSLFNQSRIKIHPQLMDPQAFHIVLFNFK